MHHNVIIIRPNLFDIQINSILNQLSSLSSYIYLLFNNCVLEESHIFNYQLLYHDPNSFFKLS